MAVSHGSAADAAVAALIGGYNQDPFAVLGPHGEDRDIVVRAFQPAARQIELRLLPSGDCWVAQRSAGSPRCRLICFAAKS